MTGRRRFSSAVIDAVRAARIVGIRAGDGHRFTGIWVVVVSDRVFVRPWNDKPRGWHRSFLDDPRGALQNPSGRELRVRARPVRGERLLDAIDLRYAEKYNTRASRKYVVGFARSRRRGTTAELVPL